jgi:hypothetical protein
MLVRAALRFAGICLFGLGLTACGAATPAPASPGGSTPVIQMDGVAAPVKAPAKGDKSGGRQKGEEGEMGEEVDPQVAPEAKLKELAEKAGILGLLNAGGADGVIGGILSAGNGTGGLGLSGIGTGGGGTGQGIGLGTIGTIGGGGGSGYGFGTSSSSGGGVTGAATIMSPTAVLELGDTSTLGVGIEQAVKMIRSRAYTLRSCYEDALRKDGQLAGSVGLRLVVGRAGEIAYVRQIGTDLGDKKVVDCMTKAMEGAYVGQPLGGLYGVIETVMSFRPAPKK